MHNRPLPRSTINTMLELIERLALAIIQAVKEIIITLARNEAIAGVSFYLYRTGPSLRINLGGLELEII